ncbi:MAG: hypothetical protein JNL80_17650 [Phycisphaerae bacterium]|jgi:hypothetical protein|nr:hypothetical protein [Phycisphaerae bacterium]
MIAIAKIGTSALVTALVALSPPGGPDRDGDGLSDFHEVHKYFTDPGRPDSDDDGVPDGDWSERREFAYTIRRVVQVLGPVTTDVLCDDYQDARVLDIEGDGLARGVVELEVIHYPINTVASAIVADAHWREHVSHLESFIAPGPTANWDPEMQGNLIAALASDGIDVAALDDRTLVERAAAWLLRHAVVHDGFSTFYTRFDHGQPSIQPGTDSAVRAEAERTGCSVEACRERELFAKSMYERKSRGSCTSTAIYLAGCLRALGIPTRLVLAIPPIDGGDEAERRMLARLRHHHVRETLEDGTAGLQNGWSSHTFNEVYVGGRWCRLNFDRLGQNILDPGYFGLLTHVATFPDWADSGMPETWGVRNASVSKDDVFGGANPYSTIALSDRFGVHATVANPPVALRVAKLTIDGASWLHDHPAGIEMDVSEAPDAGHLLVRVASPEASITTRDISKFYAKAGKRFVLRAAGHEDVPAAAVRGFWFQPTGDMRHFYLRIDADDLATMDVNARYALVPDDDDSRSFWSVADGVSITLQERVGAAPPPRASHPEQADLNAIVVQSAHWSDLEDSPIGPKNDLPRCVLLVVGPASEDQALKSAMGRCDLEFTLEAPDLPSIRLTSGIGTINTRELACAMLLVTDDQLRRVKNGVPYSLKARNSHGAVRWKVAPDLRLSR